MKKKKVVSLLLLGCLAVNLVACSGGDKTDVDYNLASSEGTAAAQSSVTGATLAQFLNEEKWTESFTVTDGEGQEVNIQIDSEVNIPKTDHMSVVEVKVPDIEGEEFSYMEEMAYPVEKIIETDKELQERAPEGTKVDQQLLYIMISPKDPTEAMPESLNKEDNLVYQRAIATGTAKNLCKYSQEEAEELARDFLVEAGYPDYEPVDISGMAWVEESLACNKTATVADEQAVDGYVITFGLADEMGNILADDKGLTLYGDYYSLRTGKKYAIRSVIEVYVVDEGIMEANFYNLVRVVKTTPVTGFLSFESIQNIVRKAFQENFEEVYIKNEKFEGQEDLILNSIELTYFRVQDKEKEGYYSYIPVWRICRQAKLGNEIMEETVYNPVLINAIDGTIINLREEF